MQFQCKSCGQIKDRTGFHTDKRAKHGVKVARCKDCYSETTAKDRPAVRLTPQESKLLREWAAKPSSRLDNPHQWSHDPIMPRIGVNEGLK